MKSFIWIGVIIVALVALMYWGVNESYNMKPPFEVGVIHPLDNIRGNASSTVVVVEYSDFQCSACRTYYFVTKQLTAEFKDEVAFVYRHFPLTNSHPNAEFAARAAEAAGKQGKFWEMHDLLFEKQNEWATTAEIAPLFESYATLIGISVEQFRKDWVSKEIKEFVRAERSNALKLRLQGTPTFFVDGEQIQNPSSVEDFRKLIKEALKNK